MGEMWNPASTGPRSFERGIFRTDRRGTLTIARFNGAALFRTRNSLPRLQDHQKRERLQRGRALSNAELHVRLSRSLRAGWLQRGRALSNAELRKAGGLHLPNLPASTGPRSFERGIHEGAAPRPRSRVASTGPRSFERGISGTTMASTSRRSTLQRGRALSNAEFDGSTGAVAQRPQLQRGRALSNAELSSAAKRRCSSLSASTGPRSFERGIHCREFRWRCSSPSFNGAALFRTRN